MRGALLGLIIVLLLTACTEEHEGPHPQASSSPSGTSRVGPTVPFPTASLTYCPLHPDTCALAREVDGPLRAFQENLDIEGSPQTLSLDDLRSMVLLLNPVPIDCTFSSGRVGDLCDGASRDQRRLGIWVSNDFAVNARRAWSLTRLQYELLYRSPRAGTPRESGRVDLRLVAIGCPTTLTELNTCREDFSLVFSSRTRYPHDDAVRTWVTVLPVSWPDGGAPAVRLVAPLVVNQDEGTYVPLLRGGVVDGALAAYTREPTWLSNLPPPDVGVFVPWRHD